MCGRRSVEEEEGPCVGVGQLRRRARVWASVSCFTTALHDSLLLPLFHLPSEAQVRPPVTPRNLP